MDVNLQSLNGADDNFKVLNLGDLDGSAGASALKCSTGLQGALITAGVVIGGHDACLDVNNSCKNLDITITEAQAGGQFVSTCKGGSVGIKQAFGKIVKRGTVCEHIFGDWSDQSHAWCTGCTLDSRMADGSAVRVIVLASDFPAIVPGSGPYRYMIIKPWFPHWLHALIVWGFETLRRWGFWRKESNG